VFAAATAIMAVNMGRLQGKRALITAAANGIGRATALAFAREGAEVLATDVNPRDLESLAAEEGRIETRILDVTQAQAVHELLAPLSLNVIFNCAGWVHHGKIEDCDENAWTRSFAVNVDSMYRICRTAIPRMIAAGGGSIINMSSVVSSIKGTANRFAYGTTKAAVIGLTKAIAADYVQQNIRCNAVCPGTVRTPSLEERVAALGGSSDEVWQSFIGRQPMGRLGSPAEIASLIVYLASDESAFTTGGTYVIDGGWSI
jgi:2-keto-3-deoxy-L-fuconate dehydrogenase